MRVCSSASIISVVLAFVLALLPPSLLSLANAEESDVGPFAAARTDRGPVVTPDYSPAGTRSTRRPPYGRHALPFRYARRPGARFVPLCRDAALHIYKERGELELFCEGRLSLRFPVTFGRDPRPRKTRIGDQRTPEGSYRVCSMVRVPRAHLFIGISYPNENEAGAALASGLLSLGQYRAIRQAHLGGRCPPRNTPLGHGIGIHGVPAGYELAASVWTWVSRIGALHRYIGFTDGCILMTNGDLERLWARVQRGTPVVIHGSRRQLWPREATAESSSFWPTSSSR